MTNSTVEYWDVDGTSLQTLAFNIVTLGGDRMAPPPVRGGDFEVPYAPGAVWVPRVVDSRILTLGMWVIGAEEDGSMPTDKNRRAQFDENWRKLRNLLWTYSREFTLTKRFYVDGSLVTAVAKASFVGGLAPTMNGPQRATFSVDLKLTDPYFYGAEVTEVLSASQTLDIAGDDVTRAIEFTIEGARNAPQIENSTLNTVVQYNANLATDDEVIINVKDFVSTTYPDGLDPYNSTGSILHSGDPSWFLLAPGDNVINVTSDSGIGAVTLVYRPVWF